MDVPRAASVARNKKIRRVLYVIVALAAVTGISVGVGRLKPAAPSVDKATLLFGTAKRGQMIRNVKALARSFLKTLFGSLPPPAARWTNGWCNRAPW